MKKYSYKWDYCIVCGKRTTSHIENKCICPKCHMGLEEKFTPEDQELLEQIKSSKLTPDELRVLLKHKNSTPEETIQPYTVRQKHIKIGVMGDTHIGSKWYDSRLMTEAAKVFAKAKVDFVVHTGDITEGWYENKRQGSVFDLTELGGDAQVARAIKELSQVKQPIYAITGNHEHNTFYNLCGFDIGKMVEQGLPNFHYLGNATGTIRLPYGKKINLLHPDGGSAYALSYRPQKIAESLDGGTKPDLLLLGHFHKAEYLFYRNIHILQTGTLQAQTDFMRGKHLSAHKGFWIVDLDVGKNGISKITPEFHPAY